ncbi:copper resistance CopC/CopD family protein [Paenibacillus wulumuqiensis]|uniref:copper resistance CopC/CopD family protein n=1 Tax=Paenibacillus wulumuqiensis TaxID=1567107 RepID=UPI00138E2546|nr:FixH family protein [Paenibacillus wulumuqiensis]
MIIRSDKSQNVQTAGLLSFADRYDGSAKSGSYRGKHAARLGAAGRSKALLHSVLALLVLLMCVLFPQQGMAHSAVVESSPSQNEVLEQSPQQIKIRFNEDIQRAYYSIQLMDSSGKVIGPIQAKIDENDGTVLKADVPMKLAGDIYNISWKAVSGDGHPVQGGIVFQVGDGAGKDVNDTDVRISDKPVNPLLVVMRWLQYAGQAMLLGALCLTLFLLPQRLRAGEHTGWMTGGRYRWFVIAGGVIALAALVAQLPLRIAWDADVPLSGTGAEVMTTLQATVFGKVWLFQMIFTVLGIAGLLLMQLRKLSVSIRKGIGMTAFVMLVVALLAKAFDGHAYAEPYAGIAIAADFIHLLSALIWSGALLALALFLPKITEAYSGEERRLVYWSIVRRFSWWAIVSVAALLVTGIYGSLVYLPELNSLFTTAYGLTLLGKILLFLIMAAFAGLNYVKGRKQEEELGKDLIWEVLTGFVILVLAAILVHLSPMGGSLVKVKPEEITAQTQQIEGYEVSLKATPLEMGSNDFIVTVKDAKGKPVDVEQIQITMTHMDMTMAPAEFTMSSADEQNGVYQKKSMISMNGRWQIDMHILTKKLDSMDVQFTIKVG